MQNNDIQLQDTSYDRKSYEEGQKIRTRARGVYKVLESVLDQIENAGSAVLDDGLALRDPY